MRDVYLYVIAKVHKKWIENQYMVSYAQLYKHTFSILYDVIGGKDLVSCPHQLRP